jgi:16S rRNA (guanine1207-N2)-methyltransferase
MGPVQRICMTVFPYTAKPQLIRDFAAAARLLSPDGAMTVRLTEQRLAAPTRRELARRFADVRLVGSAELHSAQPIRDDSTPLPDATQTVSHLDPVSSRALTFETAPGLFSFNAVDPGTRLLLDTLPEATSGRAVLDIGCGYGAIGCVLAARGARVTMIDSDWRAVKVARVNLTANHLAGDVVIGDASLALPTGPFDLAVSNPPTHAGSARLQRLFGLAADVAESVRIVVRAHLNYEKWLEAGYRTQRLAERDGYKVIAFARRR